jgi:hypothetical protein
MEKHDEVLKQFSAQALRRSNSNIICFKPAVALEILQECKRYDLRVLGIQGFILSGETIQPFMDHSARYSKIRDKSLCIKLAQEFLAERLKSEYVFEILLND